MSENELQLGKSILLKRNEIMYLAALTGNFQIVGIEAPTNMMSEDFIKSDFKKILEDLKVKNIVKVGKAGNIILDELIYAIINACCTHEAYILVNNTKKFEQAIEHHYYIAKGFIVSMLNLGNDTEYEFKVLMSIKEMNDLIISRLIMYKKDSEKTKSIELKKSVLFQIKEDLKKNIPISEVAQVVISYGYEIDKVLDIVELLNKPDIYFSIFINKLFEDTLIGDNLVLIQSEKNLYQMAEKKSKDDNEEESYEFIPLSYNKAISKISEVLENVEDSLKND